MIEGLKRTKGDPSEKTRPVTINTASGIIEIGDRKSVV